MTDALSDISTDDPSMLARILRAARPFASLPSAKRLEQLRLSGMHSPARDDRLGCDAFDIRADVSVGDACETVDQILRQLQGTLELMGCSDCTNRSLKESCGACASLARQASGALAVIKAAVFPANLR